MFYQLFCRSIVLLAFVLCAVVQANVRVQFNRHIPMRVDGTVIVSSKYFAPMKYGQPYEGLASTVGKGLNGLEQQPEVVWLTTAVGLFARYGIIRLLTSTEVARSIEACGFPVWVKDGNKMHALDSGKRYITQSNLILSSFKDRDNYVTVAPGYADFYTQQSSPHISDGLKLSRGQSDLLENIAGKVNDLLQETQLSDKATRIQILGEERRFADMASTLKQAAPSIRQAVHQYGNYLSVSAMIPMNVGPGLASAMLERALDSKRDVDLMSYVIARLDGFRYYGTPVAKSIDRLGRIYGGKGGLFGRMMCYSAITTLISPGVVNLIHGSNHSIQGLASWPDLGVWLSRWGLSGSISTRLRFGYFDLILGYEGLLEEFANVDNIDYGDQTVLLDALRAHFSESGSESAGSKQFCDFYNTATKPRDIWSYAHIFGRAMEEYGAQQKSAATYKVFEVMVGGTLALSERFSAKVVGFFNSLDNVPVGLSTSISINAPGKMTFSVGVDSLSPSSMAGNRMFVYDPKLEAHKRQTAWWMELALVC